MRVFDRCDAECHVVNHDAMSLRLHGDQRERLERTECAMAEDVIHVADDEGTLSVRQRREKR